MCGLCAGFVHEHIARVNLGGARDLRALHTPEKADEMTSTRNLRLRRAAAGSLAAALIAGGGIFAATPALAAPSYDGTYVGTSSSDTTFTLVVEDGIVVSVESLIGVWCWSLGSAFTMPFSPIPATPIADDGTFAAEWSLDTETADEGEPSKIARTQYALSGQFDLDGNVVSFGAPEANSITMDSGLHEYPGEGGCYGDYTFGAQREGGAPEPTEPANPEPTEDPEPAAPAAPAFASMADGASFAEGETPELLTGTGVDGAAVTVTSNGDLAGETVVENGEWRIPLAAQIPAGSYELVAIQTLDGVASAPVTITFTVTEPAPTTPADPAPSEPADPAPTEPVEPAPTDPAEPEPSEAPADPEPTPTPVPTGAPKPTDDGDALVPTGGDPSLSLALGGSLLVAAGASLVIARRRRA